MKLNIVVVVLFVALPAVFKITLPVCELALIDRSVFGDGTCTALVYINQSVSMISNMKMSMAF